MSEEISQTQEEINRQIDDARQRIRELEEMETGALGELKQLTHEREKYSALSEISNQLERLEELGGADLFWG